MTLLPDKLTLSPGATALFGAPAQGVGGYVWTARVEGGDGRIEAEATSPPAGGIGAGGIAQFRLIWSGDTGGTVVLQLKRPWEDAPIRTHRIEIVPERT